MKNGVLRFIPLQADLCLNKQKVDIEDFKGWQKCNAPVYGDCLSPLYKKDDTHHDIYIGNDTYDWTDGAFKKNGVTVWETGTLNKIKKRKTNEKYDALALAEVSGSIVKTFVRITSTNSFSYSIKGSAVATETIANGIQIVATKAFADTTNSLYGIVVMYLHNSGKYGYFIKYLDNETPHSFYGSGETPTLWNDFEVVSPLIQVGKIARASGATGKFIVSFFGTSGANLASTDVRNVYVDGEHLYDSPLFKDVSLYPTLYGTYTKDCDIRVNVQTYAVLRQVGSTSSGNYKTGCVQELLIEVEAHPQQMTVSLMKGDGSVLESFVFPASENDVVYKRTIAYYTGVETATSPTLSGASNYYKLEITGTSETPITYENTGSGLISKYQSDISTSTNLYILPAYQQSKIKQFYVKVEYNELSNPNDTEAPSYNTPREISFSENGITLGNFCKVGVGELPNWADANEFITYAKSSTSYVTGSTVSNPAIPQINPFYTLSFGLQTGERYGVSYDFSNVAWKIKGYPNASSQGVQYYVVIPDTAYYDIYMFYKEQYTDTALKEVDCVFDDGHLYCVGALSSNNQTPLPKQLLALSGTFGSYDSDTNMISYTSDTVMSIAYDEDDNVYPKYFEGMNISINNYYLRIAYLFKANIEDEDVINIVVDNLAIANGDIPTHLLGGVQQGTNANLQGGVYNCPATQQQDGWRILFNNNMISNVACYEKKDYIGSILADWFTIDTDFCIAFTKNVLYYKDNNGVIWEVSLVASGQDWNYRFVEDRYIVFNTTKYFNCYDTKTGQQRHWGSDYNNRIMFGYGFRTYSNDALFRDLLTKERFRGLMITSQNANYEMTKDMITGITLGAISYEGVLKDYFTFFSCDVPFGAIESIDLYRGDNDSTSALYVCSYRNSIKFINNDLVNPYAVYPISENGDIQYNPNMFTEFIKSYNNKDMVISDGIAYRLVYFNNVVPVMAYYMLDGVEELIGAFVLQTSYYGVSENRLYQMNYSNGVGVEVVADITNMEYLGALPSQALFWSAQNRAIYSFKGNCIMALMQYANELTGIYGKWYNPATQELFLDTNIGILVFSDLGTYCLEWENMRFLGNWNASTNTPHLEDGEGTDGDFYIVSVGGTVNFGTEEEPRNITFSVNDRIVYKGNVEQWTRIPAEQVSSVNGMSSNVTHTTNNGEMGCAFIKDIYFFKDRFVVNFINDTEKSYFYSYNKLTGYTSNGIYIFTKYYGNGLVPITVNNIYVRLYNQSEANAEGEIKFKGHTITDIGTETDEKTVLIGGEDDPTANPPVVAGEAWDTPTDTMLVKYSPQYNRGLGFALEIVSTFPIIDIKFDYVENGSIESQIAHVNI